MNLSEILNNTIVSNNTFCLPMQDYVQRLDENIKIIFSTFSVVFFIVSFTFNSLVVYFIAITNQWDNQSTRLICLISVFDIMASIIINGSCIIYMTVYHLLKCTTLKFIHSLVILISYSSFYMIAFIGFDRYMRVKYLNEYCVTLTPKRYQQCMLMYIAIVILQTILGCYGSFVLGYGYSTMLTAPVKIFGTRDLTKVRPHLLL